MKSYLQHNWKFLVLTMGLALAWSPLRAQQLPLVEVVAPDPTAMEGLSSGAFTLIRFGPTTADLSVDVVLSGTASNGLDYVMIKTPITIPAGSLAVDIKVDPIVDVADAGNETVIMTVRTNANYRIDKYHSAQVTIVEDVFDFLPPTVTITSPTNTSSYTNPISITITADAEDPGVTIGSVSFYANDQFLGKVTKSPFSLVWSNPPSGKFALFARAVDEFGRSALSPAVNITVTDMDPVVTLTSPTNGQNFLVHSDIPLAADASDPDPTATIASVSFYANGHLLGTSTKAPYSLVWSNAPDGFYVLRAVAKDQAGDSGESSPVLINVTPFDRERETKLISR